MKEYKKTGKQRVKEGEDGRKEGRRWKEREAGGGIESRVWLTLRWLTIYLQRNPTKEVNFLQVW